MTAPMVLKAALADPALGVMNFLNEVVQRYPEAISFAPGRPEESLFEVPEVVAALDRYVRHRAAQRGVEADGIYRQLGQYGATAGIIQDLVAQHLKQDEGIAVAPEAVMITVGAQEAMAVLLAGLFEEGDVLLASDPTYIGITGFAAVLGIAVEPVPAGSEGITAAAVAAALERVRSRGQRPRMLYDVPDFNNPLGTTLPLAQRHRLLELAARERLWIVEDNPYGMFAYEGERLPTLKALDREGVVLYLGTFSKTLFPSLRVGYLVADQWVRAPGASSSGERTLVQELTKVKSLVTVNTSALTQAAVGGYLLELGGSLQRAVEPKVVLYRRRRDALLAALEEAFPPSADERRAVRWNRPGGGFFLSLELPFPFGEAEVEACAEKYGLIACPMSFFALSPGRERQVRFAFSYVDEETLREGVRRFAAFVTDHTADW
ncbi:MAG: PLP-dependent aminotransferase family protein [Acidobacteriota bacterium]